MLGIMRGVTEKGGTAPQAAIDGYVVGGKTGTAQKVANGHYDPTKWVSSFVGVVPIEAPRLAIIVVVDEPQGGHLGGAVAAPIFKEIAERGAALPARAADRRRRRRGKARARPGPTRAAAKRRPPTPTTRPAAEAPPTELPLRSTTTGSATIRRWPSSGTRSPGPRAAARPTCRSSGSTVSRTSRG